MFDLNAAKELLHENMKSVNLRRHCYAVSVVMGSLSERLGEKERKEAWEIAGLLHDADYEITKDDAQRHTHLLMEWLSKYQVESDIKDAILAHGWGYVLGNPEPKTKMEWALYTCDELTGLIVACALVKPDKKLASVSVDSVLGKWKQKSFAAGVNRDQIEKCEEKLSIPLQEFIQISLSSMQKIAGELGL